MPHPSRRAALALLAAGTAAGFTRAPALSEPAPDGRVGSSLVLSGGGARGAYEAGVIEGLVQGAGVRDGEKLPGIDLVIGTSIGALNGWFVATAQYSALRRAWQDISASNLFRLKRQYAGLDNPNTFFASRIFESLSMLANLNRSMAGIFDSEPLKGWLRANVDPSYSPVVPFVFNAADICNMRAAYFYVRDDGIDEQELKSVMCSIEAVSGLPATAQPAGQMLHDALYASIALPLLLDPIDLVVGGEHGLFVDGGSCDNSAIDFARVSSRRVNVILTDPASVQFKPTNAVMAGLGSFNLLQRRALDASLRSAHFETAGKRLFAAAATNGEQRAYLDSVFDVELAVLRPAAELETGYGGFHDADKLRAAYDLGRGDARAGWSPYSPPQT
jgi:predicted acylesterase/phospholipase RssA